MADRIALVTGATGFIGARLVAALLERGWTVRACGRRPRPAGLPAKVDYRVVDLAGDDDLRQLFTEVTHAFHLAGASSSVASEEEMHRANVVATERLVEAASRSDDLERLLYMSSTAVYGEEVQLESPVEEQVQPQPSRPYGKAKWEAEQVVWAADRAGMAVIVMRPVTVFGPGNVKLLASAVLDAAIERFAAERAQAQAVGRTEPGNEVLLVAAEPVEHRLVHLNDVVRAALHLAVHPWSPGQAYNVVFPSYPTSHQLAEVIAGELGMKVELSDDRECGLRLAARLVAHEQMLDAGMEADIVLTEERFRFLRKANINNRLSIDALLSTGFQFEEADLETGIRATIGWYLEHRWIL